MAPMPVIASCVNQYSMFVHYFFSSIIFFAWPVYPLWMSAGPRKSLWKPFLICPSPWRSAQTAIKGNLIKKIILKKYLQKFFGKSATTLLCGKSIDQGLKK